MRKYFCKLFELKNSEFILAGLILFIIINHPSTATHSTPGSVKLRFGPIVKTVFYRRPHCNDLLNKVYKHGKISACIFIAKNARIEKEKSKAFYDQGQQKKLPTSWEYSVIIPDHLSQCP